MRPVMHGDLVAAARVLFGMAEDRRAAAIAGMLRQAEWADAYRRKSGKVHPVWGDGSLMSVALNRRPGSEPALSDRGFCGCLAEVLEALIANGP